MVNQLLETSHPLSSSALRLSGSVACPVLPFWFTQGDSCEGNSSPSAHSLFLFNHLRKPISQPLPFQIHAGMGGGFLLLLFFLTSLHLYILTSLSPSQARTHLRAIIGVAASASAEKASRK
jgi:hypothetical protein